MERKNDLFDYLSYWCWDPWREGFFLGEGSGIITARKERREERGEAQNNSDRICLGQDCPPLNVTWVLVC